MTQRQKIGILILIISLILIILLVAVVLIYTNKRKKYKYIGKFDLNTDKKKKTSKIYDIFERIPILGVYISNIKARLYLTQNLDEVNIRNRAIYISIFAVISSIVAFYIINKLYGYNLYMKFTIFIGCIYLNNLIINNFVKNPSIKLLKEMPEFINDIKHYYHSTEMVDEAIYEASIISKDEIAIQGKKIYDIITSSTAEMEIEDYYEKCPNKFLKILAGFSFLIKEYGDKKVNGVSLYIRNLNYLIEEINLEIIKASQLSYWLKGLPVIALVPLAFPPFLKSWLSSSFSMLNDFFNSSMAFFLENMIIFVSVLSYVLILQIQKNESKTVRFKSSDKILDFKILKIEIISKLISLIKPKNNTSKYKNLSHLLRDSGSPLNIECIYLRRISVALIAFVVMLAIFATSHYINTNSILNNASYGLKDENFFKMLGKISDDDRIQKEKTNQFDLKILSEINGANNKENLKEKIGSLINKYGYIDEDKELVIERILNKYIDKNKETIKFWELLIVIFLSWMISFLPIIVLNFQKSLRKADMQDEVFQFHTIIILLIHHNNVDVSIILEWMRQFSDIFKNAINRCINNFQNPIEALEQLKQDVKFKEFVNIIDNFEMAIDKIDIISAFNSLELEKDFYKENRKEQNRQLVNKKIELGKFIGFIPFYAVIVLYLVLPLLISSAISIKSISEQLSSI